MAVRVGSSIALALLMCATSTAQDVEPSAQMVEDIEEGLGVYLIHPDKREALERVLVSGGRAEVWFLRTLEVNSEDAKCDALRWLLLGRLKTSDGARSIFERYPDVETIALVFYTVETRVRVTARGEYEQSRTAVRTLEVSVDRARGVALDRKTLEPALRASRTSCIAAGEESVDHHWYIR